MPIRHFTKQDIRITPNLLDEFGAIYSFAFNPSAGETSSTLFINIVNQEGFYDVNSLKKAMSYLTYFKFDILGGYPEGLTMFAFLVGYTESISNQSKTLRLEFKDGSHILDRVYVALLNKEVEKSSQNSIPELKTFSKKIFCETCDPLQDVERFSVKTFDQRRIINNASSPFSGSVWGENIYGSPISGGLILVGKEKYTKSNCEIANCDYNFTELKNAAAKIGVFIRIPDIFPFYRITDSGTLKEKLTQFCSKFGFGFRYDFSQNPRSGHYIYPTETPDGNNSVYAKLEKLKKFAKDFKSLNPKDPVVINITDEESIESTEKRFTSLLVKKNGEYQEKTKTVNYKAVLNPIKLRDVMKFNTEHSGFRSEAELITSSVMAKYSRVARILYNIGLSGSGGKPKALIPLGFLPLSQLRSGTEKIEYITRGATSVKAQLLKMLLKWHLFFKDGALVPEGEESTIKPKFQEFDPEMFDVYIGVHSEENEKKYEKLETDILKFLGKYYFNFITPDETVLLNPSPFMQGSITVKLTPESKQYFISDKVCSEVTPRAIPSPVPLNISAISSYDGAIVSAVENVGKSLNSTDSGSTWNKDNLPGNKPWTCVASSKDGVNVYAASNGHGVYRSQDSGLTWELLLVRNSPDTFWWTSIACSQDGAWVFAVNSSELKYYQSPHYGSDATWSSYNATGFPLANAQDHMLSSIICSSDGSRVSVSTLGGDFYSRSTTDLFGDLNQLRFWDPISLPVTCAACSDDGKTIFLSRSDRLGAVVGSHIYRSQNYGQPGTFSPMLVSPKKSWASVSCSFDGKNVTALTSGGDLYISFDSGFSWVLQEAIKGWRAVIVSRSGKRIIGSTLDKKFYNLLFPTKTPDGSIEELVILDASSISTSKHGDIVSIAANPGFISTSDDLTRAWRYHPAPGLGPNLWVDVASSSDGKTIFAARRFGMAPPPGAPAPKCPIDYSSTTGALGSWLTLPEHANVAGMLDREFTSIACSSDGKMVYAADAHNGFLFFWTFDAASNTYIAHNATVNGSRIVVQIGHLLEFEPAIEAEPKTFTSIACSAIGDVVILSTVQGQIYERNLTLGPEPNNMQFVRSTKQFDSLGGLGLISCVACSANGTVLFFTVDGGFIYRKESTAWNSSWSETNSLRGNWSSISCSASGREAIALTKFGQLYVSSDSGNKWVLQAHPKRWKVAKITEDGQLIVGTVLDGRVFVVPFADEVPSLNTGGGGDPSLTGETLETQPRIECRQSSCFGHPLPFIDVMEGGVLPDGSKLLNSENNKVTIHERTAVFAGDDQIITEFLQKVTIRVERLGCKTTSEDIEEVSNPLDIFKPIFYKLTGPIANYQLTTLDTRDLVRTVKLSSFQPLTAKSATGIVIDPEERKNIINFACAILPSKKLIDKLFKISPIHPATNTKDKTWHNDIKKRAAEERNASMLFCKVQEDPSSENDVQWIKDATGQFFANPCYCRSSPFSGARGVFDPNKKPHVIGLKTSIASSFVIKLEEIFGKSHESLISLDPRLSAGELQVILPCGTLLGNSITEEYAANFSETIARTMFYYPFIKTYHNFEPQINAAKINVSHEDLSHLVYREFSNPKVFSNFTNGAGQIIDIPLEIESPTRAGFMSLLDYFKEIKAIEENSSMLLARKKLTITLAATDSLGAFVNFLKANDGFSSISIEKSNDVLNLILSFENKPPKKFDMFRELTSAAKIGREF